MAKGKGKNKGKSGVPAKSQKNNKGSRSKNAPANEFFLTRFFRTIVDFMKGVRAELKKVTWLSREDLIQYTAIVIVICAIMSVFVWGLDTVFGFLKGLIS